jgi:hypothetical protein
MAVTTKDFIRRWLEEMEHGKRGDRTSYWQAEEAIAELDEKYRRFLAGSSALESCLDDLVREAIVYESMRPVVAESNQAFRSALAMLSTFQSDAKIQADRLRQKPGPAFTLISSYVEKITEEIESCSNGLQAQHSAFWHKKLTPLPGREQDAQEIFIPLEVSDEWSAPLEESYIGSVKVAVERGLRLPDPKPEPRRGIDLDYRFQVRVAWIFKLAFPRLTRETRARLVVLVYICFNFVAVNPGTGKARIRANKKELTVAAVYEKLKRFERQFNSKANRSQA